MNNLFKVGDKVRILDGSKNKSYCGGWIDEMYKYVGKTSIVIGSSERGVYLEGNVFTWDARYLELIERGKMENKITIDGKEYELSVELVEKIKAEVTAQEQDPFARVKHKPYFLITGVGKVSTLAEGATNTDDELYSIANYCHDKGLMEQRALHETLNRLLWRYRETHGGDNAWNSQNLQEHYYIYLQTQFNTLYVSYNDAHHVEGVVYFKDRATAEAAIEEVVKPFMAAHPEFVW